MTEDQSQYTKPQLATNLITRIQNLLPDYCQICSSAYATDVNEKPLLTCAICGQGSHTNCITTQLGIDADVLDALTSDDVMNAINPKKFKGLHYLCYFCTKEHIPDPKSAPPTPTLVPITVPIDDAQMQPAAAGTNNPTVADAGLPKDAAPNTDAGIKLAEGETNVMNRKMKKYLRKSGDTAARKEPTQGQLDKESKNNNACPDYKIGTCKFGVSGIGCPKPHPKPCFRYLNHGPHKERDARGRNATNSTCHSALMHSRTTSA